MASLSSHVTDYLKGLGGATVHERYQLTRMIDIGGFGAIYRAKDISTGMELVAKIEGADSPLAKNEAAVLKELNNVFHAKGWTVQEPVAKLYGYFENENFTILLMEPLGPSVRDLKKSLPTDRFSTTTSLWVCSKMLESIEFMHSLDMVHADVKPSNFCIGVGMRSRQMFVIDFGVARKTRPSSKTTNQTRETTFIGTARYASSMTQKGIDDGKLGDLWSIYFTAIENLMGQLPWRYEQNRENIIWYKQQLQYFPTSFVIHPWFAAPGPPPSILYFLKLLQKDKSMGEEIKHQVIIRAIQYDLKMLGIEHRYLDWETHEFKDDYVGAYWINPYV